MYRILIISIIAIFICSCSEQKETKYDLVIQNVGLFDGESDRGIVNVGIKNDSIALITEESIDADSLIDGRNKYLLPGLINSHVHVTSPNELKESLNAGVLAVIDLHQSSEQRAAKLRSYRDSLNYAYFASSGFAATLPGGHPTQYGNIETINDSTSAKEWVQHRLDNGADLIKIIRDAGGGPPDFKEIPTLSLKQIEEIINASKYYNKLSIAHSVTLDETMSIVALDIDGLAHLWFGNESLTEQQLASLSQSGIFVIPTAQTQTKIWEMVANGPPQMKGYAEQNISSMELVKSELLRLHQTGIKILAGNDPPNFGINYGDDFFAELQIYKDAGIPNLEVLKTATGNPANIFDLKDIGTIKERSVANMLLIDGNPLENLEYLRRIKHIWKNGKKIK